MADFDPDAFIAKAKAAEEPKTAKFDPDAFIAKAKNESRPSIGAEDNPVTTDVFKSNAARTASSFGNEKGILKNLPGYVNVKKNVSGDLVFKSADGQWYKDASNFSSHPINWLESKIGSALPLAGMSAGGAAGSGVASIPLAAAGAGLGEAGRQFIGRNMGVYDAGLGESAKDIGTEALTGGFAELGGKVAGAGIKAAAPYVEPILKPIANAGKNAVAGISEFLTGIPKEAVSRLIERPSQVLAAEAEGNAFNVANKARQELLNKNKVEKGAISQARKDAVAKYGSKDIDTKPLVNNLDAFLADKGSAPGIEGALSDTERSGLAGLRNESLQSNGQPQRSFADMQKLADQLKRSQGGMFDGSALPGGSSANKGQLESLYGQVKGAMHEVSPELKAADQKFTDYANKADLFGRLEDAPAAESFINNFYGKNKTLMREAAPDLIPDSLNDIADLGASRAFTKQGPAGSEMGARRMLSTSVGTALGTHGAMTHSPIEMALGGAAALATSPGVHKTVIGNASKLLENPVVRTIMKRPELISTISNPALKKQIVQAMESAGVALPKAASLDGRDREPAVHPGPQTDRPLDEKEAQKQFIEGNQ